MPHPVVLMARVATWFETCFRKQKISEKWAGRCTVVATLVCVGVGVSFFFFLLFSLSPWLLAAGCIYLLYTTLALRSLSSHAMAVYSSLLRGEADGNLEPARQSVGLIVGRRTDNLDREGIIRACVESVAENMSDGVIAPLFYAVFFAFCCLVIGLSPYSLAIATLAALLYKTVNTMDSMFGYKNEKYLHFGRTAALLDDAVNFVPARLTALLLVTGAMLTRKNGLNSLKILIRDRRQHASPNAGYPESAMAGALGLQLGGENSYFGKVVAKPTIGDGRYSLKSEHIKAAVRLMITSSLLFLVFVSFLSFVVSGICQVPALIAQVA
jgi:adenosylcobinamide-phosphate synthase